jgi:hypothetical protein
MTCGDLLKLSRRFYGADGNRKPDHYFEVYERYFAPFRHAPIDILEIGVADGISLRIWREYFSAANIIGIDTRGAPQGIAALIESQRVKHVVGDQSCPTDLEKCLSLSRSGKFDVVIDDASHIGALSKASFEFLFPRLVSGGLYFIEDYGTGYMGNFPDGGAIAGNGRLVKAAHRSDALVGDQARRTAIFADRVDHILALARSR